MYEIFENARDNQGIFEAYSNLQNYKVLNFDRQGGGTVTYFLLPMVCFFQQQFQNLKKKLLKKINLNG